MHFPSHEQKQAILEKVLRLADQRLSGAAAQEARTFIAHYFDQADVEDLASRTVEDLYGAALAHLGFARRFASGMPKLRVYNPRLEEHGWTSPHTVIEIVNDDMPFLVDSVGMEINHLGYTQHLLLHPILRAKRDNEGELQAIAAPAGEGQAESLIHVEVDRETDPERLKAIGMHLQSVLADVRAAVQDWKAMSAHMDAIVLGLAKPPVTVDAAEAAEIRDFLAWAADHHFTFLGYREYQLTTVDGQDQLKIVPRSGLGVLREPKLGGLSQSFAELPAALRALAREPRLLVLTKANTRATVHRPGYLDYIGIKQFDAAGRVVGERRFVGLYTSSAYQEDPSWIPLLRRKVAKVIAQAGFPEGSHAYKNLLTVLHDYPRDELIQVDDATLSETALGILRLGDRRRTRVFVRRDLFGRFFSCMIFLPRENYNTDVRVKIQEILKRHLGGATAEFTVQLSDAVLARIHMLVRTSPKETPAYDVRAIEAEIVLATRRWDDDLKFALTAALGEDRMVGMLRTYANAFPVAYREAVAPRAAVRDIQFMETLKSNEDFALNLYRPQGADDRTLRLRIFRMGKPIPLSASLPVLEHMGLETLDEVSYEVERQGAAGTVYLHDFGMRSDRPIADVAAIKALTEEALARVSRGDIEDDGFNRLTPGAAIAPDDVVVLRAYAKYLKQSGFTFSQDYIEKTLAAHAGITTKLVALFHARFDPAGTANREEAQQKLHTQIKEALNDVANLDEDRILHRFLYVIGATLRTNHWVKGANGRRKHYLSLKIESAKVPELPEPRPLFEVFVYSPRVEAIHLRGGKVARGGLRWSDRPEDFRTEVLGLMKAQMVKNAVIVPVGSKGGFVVKKGPPPSDREAWLKEGVSCYKNFLRGLLDITDNRVAGKIVPPKDVVRHDPDDPYLVVAADKGTATFSDIANGVSAEYGFWLADAFASGGSAGYDHKKMGITAKGAWESVMRHFREMGIDTQSQDFSVAGIGDMSGDVFGNGMLLSRRINLVAAFDHRHIFLDPSPDPEASFKERERMFVLPRSSWEDYDKKLISKGGGIFPRSAKSIPISPQVKAVLGITEDSLAPQELMKAILKAPVDLLYNGGIGTYVKAASQANTEAGDRANDAIRVNGGDLRCKVVGEGGNLGFTQLGRVEYALKGGRICTDAIDNSAGVDCSDHEVNIKILLGQVVAEGGLDEAKRNVLLAQMTDEVGDLVLADNYYQTQSLAVSGVRGEKLLDGQAAFIRALEKAGQLNRAVEYLPSDDEIAERRADKVGLTSPERAVLLAYSKMVLFEELCQSPIVDDPYVAKALMDYFPTPLREKYPEAIAKHALRREIIATVVANTMINRTGSIFVHRMQDETGASSEEVVRSFILVRDIFGLESLWSEIDSLDNRVPASLQSEMLIDVGRLLLRGTLWFLRRRREKLPIAEVLEIFWPGLAALQAKLPAVLSSGDRVAWEGYVARLSKSGVPEPLAKRLAALESLYAALDVTEVAIEQKKGVDTIATLYFSLVGELELRWFGERITALPTDTPWQALARNALRDDLSGQQRALTQAVAKLSPQAGDAAAMLAAWKTRYAPALTRLKGMTDEVKRAGSTDLAVLSVLLRELRGLA
ncbi:NAD-glutamate dehydrogenase [Usitatibacter palustris]|uniref:NAD-specific glutamate dehydrogenase n=1 Tax=Usitatibacter palustris TaxID=2732487 RepID=A0A6M4H7P5_9PROT|nr:NAD-glutamate dehydrogenase [Usitatibacter palustris]QJR15392.1 NAD-specific glutamate dehydrogenase [Usitatibacter palustris]